MKASNKRADSARDGGEPIENRLGDRVRLSVVIPCLNEARGVDTQLGRLAEERWSEPWEIVVADNGSTDGTKAIVREYQKRIENLVLVDASSRPGASHARNVGVSAARGGLVAFCDADDEIQPGWVAAMGQSLGSHELVAGRLDSTKLNERWAVRGRPQDDGLNALAGHLPHALSTNLGVRRALHERVGGFDEEFLGAAHDVDYCWRLQRAGAELHFDPRVVMAYRFRHDFLALFRQARFYAIGMVSIYRKHLQHGLPQQRHPWLLGVLTWAGLLKVLPIRPSKHALATFVWTLGWKVGMVEGSIRNRVLLLSPRGLRSRRAPAAQS
jgi:glycosyltransferase involved in cell wall biosynthesis